MEVARKITVGGINGIRKGFKGITELTFVARIGGIVSSVVRESGQLGEYWKFTGEFQGTNKDGELTMAPVCMLPAPADEMLAQVVNGSEGGQVKFGFDFYVEPREDLAIGYAYKIKPLLEVKPSNPFADLLSELPPPPVQPKQLAIASEEKSEPDGKPAEQAEKAPEPEPAKKPAKK